jgi:hypothetical protein
MNQKKGGFTQGYPTHAFLWIHLECDGCDGEIPGVLWGYFLPALWDLGVSENVVYPQLWQFD